MQDIPNETNSAPPSGDLLTLTDSAKIAPGRPSTNCLWRWCRRGVMARSGERIRLGHVRIGGKIFTSKVWLEEFGRKVAQADTEHFDAADRAAAEQRRRQRSMSREEQCRQERIVNTRRMLDAAGI